MPSEEDSAIADFLKETVGFLKGKDHIFDLYKKSFEQYGRNGAIFAIKREVDFWENHLSETEKRSNRPILDGMYCAFKEIEREA